jgi:hypothetical protein
MNGIFMQLNKNEVKILRASDTDNTYKVALIDFKNLKQSNSLFDLMEGERA